MSAALVDCCVEEVPHQPELRVSAYEGRLEPGGSTFAAPRGDDSQRSPQRDGLCFALQDVLARVLVRDRSLRASACRVVHE